MLRNRSIAVSRKQGLMADHTSHTTTTTTTTATQTHGGPKPSSFFGSPTFKAFTLAKENDSLLSPTSILDSKPFFSSSLTNPFSHPKITQSPPVFPGNKHRSPPWDDHDHDHDKPRARGISLVLNDERRPGFNRVQIPRSPSPSPTEFGVKTRNSLVPYCGSGGNYSGSAVVSSVDQQSEDYTCVISHGPVARTTHIFENCVVVETVGCFSGDGDGDGSMNGKLKSSYDDPHHSPQSFLSFCHTCKKNLQMKNIDIYIYRGEKAFCSRECRYQEMILDGNEDFDDHTITDCF